MTRTQGDPRGGGYSAAGVRLAWAVVDGELAPISAFGHLGRGDRPRAICPVCECDVVFVLGKQTAHHFRHGDGSDCPVKGGETAEHLNTKFYIADLLRRAAPDRRVLRVTEQCIGVAAVGLDCSRERAAVFVRGWDDVHVERGLAELRPDVLLMRGGAPLAAIEVYRTHEVGELKALRLTELGVCWIEVPAGEEIYAGARPWTLSRPIPTLRVVPVPESRCADCTRIHREAEERRRRDEMERAYRASLRRRAVRVVDLYRRSGDSERAILTIGAEYVGDTVRSVALVQETTDRILHRIHVRAGPGGRRAAHAALEARFLDWKQFRVGQGNYADEASDGWVYEAELAGRDPDMGFPPRYLRDGDGWSPAWAGVPPMPPELRPSVPTRAGLSRIIDSLDLRAAAAFAAAWANGGVRYAARVVDWYSPDGTCERNVLHRYVWQNRHTGTYLGALRWAAGEAPPLQVEGRSAAACEEALEIEYHRMAEFQDERGCAMDSPMDWIFGGEPTPEGAAVWPQRMAWSVERRCWVRRLDYERVRWAVATPLGTAPQSRRGALSRR